MVNRNTLCSSKLVKFLISVTKNVDQTNDKGNTALFYLIKYQSSNVVFKIMDLLLARGANINHLNNKKMTPLMLAARTLHQNSLEIIKFLIQRGANIYHESKFKQHLFMKCHFHIVISF